jgi:hypothetical protein
MTGRWRSTLVTSLKAQRVGVAGWQAARQAWLESREKAAKRENIWHGAAALALSAPSR